jgi:hypothetical protein
LRAKRAGSALTVSQCSANDVIRPRNSGESRCEIGVNAAAALRTAFAVPRKTAGAFVGRGRIENADAATTGKQAQSHETTFCRSDEADFDSWKQEIAMVLVQWHHLPLRQVLEAEPCCY